MRIAPAGEDRESTGHHHLLIDAELPSLDQPITNDANHLHFDAGETEAEITLAPGTHTLQLLLGDKDHIAHNPAVMSQRIRVIASEGGAVPAATARPSAQRQTVPSLDALRRRIPETLERFMPDRFPILAISAASDATNTARGSASRRSDYRGTADALGHGAARAFGGAAVNATPTMKKSARPAPSPVADRPA